MFKILKTMLLRIDTTDLGEYNGLRLTSIINNDLNYQLNTNIVVDWYWMMNYILNVVEGKEHIGFSSSVDHFIMNNNNIKCQYVDLSGDYPVLKNTYKSNYIEVLVPTNTNFKTYDEYKEYVYNLKIEK